MGGIAVRPWVVGNGALVLCSAGRDRICVCAADVHTITNDWRVPNNTLLLEAVPVGRAHIKKRCGDWHASSQSSLKESFGPRPYEFLCLAYSTLRSNSDLF